MNPLNIAYGAAVHARNAMFDHGLLQARSLPWPVISIGNLSVGGSGKTPFTILLGELLQTKGIAFDILSRGYKRKTSGIKLVDEMGSASDFGDEPLLLARKLHVPVIVGADRYAAGQFAERLFSGVKPAHGNPWLHLLDDGFQHRRLARHFDIVMVNPDDLSDELLPGGRLREPLSSLRRAHAIVAPAGLEHPLFAGKLVWRIQRKVTLPSEIPPRPIAFCGIAKPERFLRDLRSAGVTPVEEVIFPDHHAYSVKDVRALLAKRDQNKAGGFLTTEKDMISLQPHLATLGIVTAVPLKLELQDANHVMETILGKIAEDLHCRTID